MPHVDEKLLGVTTVASAGLFAAIILQPIVDGASGAGAVAHDSAAAFVAVAGVPLRAIAEKIPAWRAIAEKIKTWLATRERASADRDILANMSERELLDIGLNRASADAIANGMWIRERSRDPLHDAGLGCRS